MSSTSIKALGVHTDNTLGMQKQVNEVSRTSFAKLSNMYKIWKCMTEDGATTMLLIMITSGLNYCNSLYYGLLSPRKTLLCLEISCQIDNPYWQV